MKQQIPDTIADARLTGLEQFLEFWFGPRRSEYGESPAKLTHMELPGSLRRFHAFAGRWPPAFPPYCANRFHAQDRFLPLDPGPWGNVYRADPYLVFIAENQGVWEAATLPAGDDPGVWVSEDCSHRTSHPRWRQLDNPLSHFLVTFVLQESLFGSEFCSCHENALRVFENAACQIEPIWLNGEFTWPDVRHDYFLIDHTILLRRDTGDVVSEDHWFGFNDPASAELAERLNLPSRLS